MRQSQAEPQDPRGSLANAMRIVHTISGQKRGDTTFDLRRNPDLQILPKAGITAGDDLRRVLTISTYDSFVIQANIGFMC